MNTSNKGTVGGGVAWLLIAGLTAGAMAAARVPAQRVEEARPAVDGVAAPDEVAARFETLRTQMVEKFQEGAIRQPTVDHGSIISRAYTCSKAAHALALLWSGEQDGAADRQILEICNHYETRPDDISYIHDSNAWAGSLFVRLIRQFGSGAESAPARLGPEAEARLLELMWKWAQVHSNLEAIQYDQTREWRIHESENHDAQRYTPMWGFTLIFKEHPDYRDRRFADGRTPAEHFEAWTSYYNTWLTERARRGLFVEMATNFYSIHTLKGIYDMADFSPDPDLKLRAEMLLDLFWACFAQEQLDGVRGGAKSRLYQGPCRVHLANNFIGTLAWYYFGIGRPDRVDFNSINVGYAGMICAATSAYRPHPVVTAIALNPAVEHYEISERWMGLARPGFHRNPDYRLPTGFGGILRYSWRTPDYLMGTALLEPRPGTDWALISSQNRWHGVIFRGHPHARIYPECTAVRGSRTYNEQWSVQKRGALIAQKLKTHELAGPMRVWLASPLTRPMMEQGWVFVEAPQAYAAICAVEGGFKGDPSALRGGTWLEVNAEFSPVIIQVARKSEFSDYAAFQRAVLVLPLRYEERRLTYVSLHGDELVFDANQQALPEINGAAVDLQPAWTFKSPLVESAWASGLVVLKNGSLQATLDFETPRRSR